MHGRITVLVIGCSGAVVILDHLLRRCRESNPACQIIHINPFEDSIGLPRRHLFMRATVAMERLDPAIRC